MTALSSLVAHALPFLLIGLPAQRWLAYRTVVFNDVQASAAVAASCKV